MRISGSIFMLALLAFAPRGDALALQEFQVVVNQRNTATSVSRKFLEDAFLKKIKYWDNGGAILPVDLGADSGTRANFSKEILRRPVSAVRTYWQQMIFSGRAVQPPEFSSDADVLSYVRKNPNAVGYISLETPLGASVKTVPLR